MATFNVFQIQLSEQQIDEVNYAGDLNQVEWGKIYLKLTWNVTEKNEYMNLIRQAIKFGLVHHTMTVEADTFDQVYNLGNGLGDQTNVVEHNRHKSVSMGDIIVNDDDGSGAVVAMFGFKSLTKDDVDEIETLVTQQTIM